MTTEREKRWRHGRRRHWSAARRLALPALVLAALAASGVVREAAGEPVRAPRVVVVADVSAGPDPALVAAAARASARAEREGAEAEFRVTRTPTEQLAVTHYFAARGYDAIVGVGLDRRIAVDPVAARYPATRFVTTSEAALTRAAVSATAAAR